jgi:hypothetical protein
MSEPFCPEEAPGKYLIFLTPVKRPAGLASEKSVKFGLKAKGADVPLSMMRSELGALTTTF